jgi:ribosomal protein S27AE
MAKARCPECGSTELSIHLCGWSDFDGEDGEYDNSVDDADIDGDDPDVQCKNDDCNWCGSMTEAERAADKFEEDGDGNTVKKSSEHPDQEKLIT